MTYEDHTEELFAEAMANPFNEIPFSLTNSQRMAVHSKRRKIRLAIAKSKGDHTPEEWQAILNLTGGACARCGGFEQIQKDHIVPIYQGGSNGASNLQPLCRTCNAAKGSDTTNWLRA